MTRNTALTFLNPLVAVLFASQALTGFFHDSLSHEAFEAVHCSAGILLTVCVIGHAALNWNWVRANLLRRRRADRKEP